jgi:hypothetical protein
MRRRIVHAKSRATDRYFWKRENVRSKSENRKSIHWDSEMRNCWAGGELPILLKKNNGGFLMLALLMWSMARVGGCVRAASSFLSVVHTHAAWGRKDHRKKVAWRRAHVMFFFLSGSFVSVMRGLTSNDPIRSECRLMWWLFYSPCLDGSTTAAYEVQQSTSTDDFRQMIFRSRQLFRLLDQNEFRNGSTRNQWTKDLRQIFNTRSHLLLAISFLRSWIQGHYLKKYNFHLYKGQYLLPRRID